MTFRRATLIALCLLLLETAASAQSTGTIRGIVSDPSGAVVSGATVRLTFQTKGVEQVAVTTQAGEYVFPFLVPGLYRVAVVATGFKTYARDNISVAIAEPSVVDVSLQVGRTSETIQVAGVAPLVQAETSGIGRSIESSMLNELPLSSRNVTQALALTPGVTAQVPDAGEIGRNSVNISANGARPFDNSLIMDSLQADNVMSAGFDDSNDKTGVPIPAADAIEEYKVQTALYDAEFGRQGGAVVNVVTKSGTNAFHGAVYEYLRNDAFNANEFFLNSTGQAKPVLKQNQFGGNVGGPIIKNKLFFFASYEGTRQLNGTGTFGHRSVFLPPIGQDRSRAALGAQFGGQAGLLGGVSVANDGNNINPAALNILNAKLPNGDYLIPTPQTILPSGSGFSAFSQPARFTEDQGIGNLDYVASSKNRVAIKTFYATLPQHLPFTVDNSTPIVLPGFGENDQRSNLNAGVSDTYVFRPNSINELRAGYSRIIMVQTPIDPISASELGISPAVPGSPFTGAPLVELLGGFSFGPATNNDQENKIFTYQLSDTLSLSRGRHQIRLGGDFQRSNVTRVDNYLDYGNVFFLSFPDFLLGMSAAQNGSSFSNVYYSGTANGVPLRHPRFRNLAFFGQDDFRATKSLTLNLGLRYQYNGNQYDSEGQNGGFFRSLIPVGSVPPPLPQGSLLGFVVPGNADISVPPEVTKLNRNNLIPNNRLGFSPRAGLAWRPVPGLDSFVVRAGYGIFWGAIPGTVTEQDFFNPWYVYQQSGGSVGPSATFQNPYSPVPPLSAFPLFVPYFLNSTAGVYPTGSDVKQPYNQEWSANLQYGFKTFVVELAYVGSNSTHLGGYFYPNQALLASPQHPINGETDNTIENINLRTPVLGWSPIGINEYNSYFNANYNSLQASIERRMATMTFLASYTWSHSIDNIPSNFGGRNQPLGYYLGDNHNLASGRGNSDFDVRHRLSVSYSWNLPSANTNSILGHVTRHWVLSGITTAQSGFPFSVIDSTSGTIYGLYAFSQFAPGMSVGNAKLGGSVESHLNRYFNVGAFTSAPTIGDGTGFGNSGRNILIGPRAVDFDVALARQFVVGGLNEAGTLEFRSEAFNIFNHPVFGNPGNDFGSPDNFGVISSTVVNPRILQFAVKYRF